MKRVQKKFSLFLTAILLGGICFAGCQTGEDSQEITVYMPDGAPALAMAGLMAQDTNEDGVTYRVVDASLISAQVTYKKEEKNADFCVMPVNAAAKLLGDGNRYKMLGAVTQGNVYMISKDQTQYTADNLHTLIGKTVGVLQSNNVPGLTFKATLNRLEIPYAEITNEGGRYEDKVNLVAITGPDAVGVLQADCFVLAEPAATLQNKKGYAIVGDLQSLYGGEQGYPQAVLVAKREFVQERADWTEQFVLSVQQSAAWLQTATGAQIVQTVTAHLQDKGAGTSLNANALTSDALSRCGVRYRTAADCMQDTLAFLGDLITVNASAAVLPSENFFWTE